MKNLTPEMIEKAKTAKTYEELLEIAKANKLEITADEAATYFAQLNPKSGELDDDALDGVAGGCGGSGETYVPDGTIRVTSGQTCEHCGSTEGYVMIERYSAPVVYCNKCHTGFAFFLNCTYEVIG